MEENWRLEDVNERVRKAADSENGRDMVDRVCTPATVSNQMAGWASTMTEAPAEKGSHEQ